MANIVNGTNVNQAQLNNYIDFSEHNKHKCVHAINSVSVEANDVMNYMDATCSSFKAVLLKNGNGTVEDSSGKRTYKNGKLVESICVKNGDEIKKQYSYKSFEDTLIQECDTYVNGKYDSCVSTAQITDKKDPTYNKKITINTDADYNITKLIFTELGALMSDIPSRKTTIIEMKDAKITAKEYCRDGNGKPYQLRGSSSLDEIQDVITVMKENGYSQQEIINSMGKDLLDACGFGD